MVLSENEIFLQLCSVSWKFPEILGNIGGTDEALNQDRKQVSLLHLRESPCHQRSDSRLGLFLLP